MGKDADQMTRAGNYVLGLMGERERERAEHDLEIDPSFREAVLRVAERMHMFDAAGATKAAEEDDWNAVAARIANLPQMRGTAPTASDLTRTEFEAGRAGLIAPSPVARENGRSAGTRTVAAAASIAVALVAAGIGGYLFGLRGGPARPAFVAVLEAPGGTPGAVLEIGTDDALRLVVTDGLAASAARPIELWTVPPGGEPPVIVGRIDGSGAPLRAEGGPATARAGQVYRLLAGAAAGETSQAAVLAEGEARPVVGR